MSDLKTASLNELLGAIADRCECGAVFLKPRPEYLGHPEATTRTMVFKEPEIDPLYLFGGAQMVANKVYDAVAEDYTDVPASDDAQPLASG